MTVRQTEKALDSVPPTTGWRRFAFPSIADVVFVAIFSVALALGANLTQRDGDLARHLRIGRRIIEDGQLPTIDVYSHTRAGGEMVPYEWLGQAGFAAAERWLGFDGIGLLTALLVALPWVIMYHWLVKRATPVGLSVMLVLLGMAASMIHWASRPHAFTWLFVVLYVILLEDLRRGHRQKVWVLVPLALLWVNTHGAFVVGFVLLGTYLLGAVVESYRSDTTRPSVDPLTRHLFLVLVGVFLVSFVNPGGYRTVFHPFLVQLGNDFLLNFTTEYNSPDFHNPLMWPFLAMILLSIALPFRWTTTTLLLTVSWFAAGLYSFRHVPLCALVVTPHLAHALAVRWPAGRRGRLATRLREYSRMEGKVIGGSLSVILIAITIISMSRTPGSGFEFSRGFFPIGAMETVGEMPPGQRVFNQFVWGGYLVYCCHPDIPVFIDGQTDFYGPELTAEYDQTIRGLPVWREVFEKYDIDWVLISPNTGLAQVLVESDDWSESYRDETSLVFARAP